jgi:enoyl-CoA hydratase/carnithine racemase
LERQGAVGLLVLDRPPANAYDYALLRRLGDAIDTLRLEDSLRAALVVSAGDLFFCGGADVAAFAAGSARHRATICLLAHEVFRKIELTPMPFVAAIWGHALGGGLELALACSARVAAMGDYRLGLPEVALGLLPGSGGTQRLPRLIGLPRALDMIVTGSTVSPAEALALGLVDRVLPDRDSCREAALALALDLARPA